MLVTIITNEHPILNYGDICSVDNPHYFEYMYKVTRSEDGLEEYIDKEDCRPLEQK